MVGYLNSVKSSVLGPKRNLAKSNAPCQISPGLVPLWGEKPQNHPLSSLNTSIMSICIVHILLVKIMIGSYFIPIVAVWWFITTWVNCGRFCVFAAVSLCSFVCVWNISWTSERICAKFTGKTCFVPCSDEFVGQGHQGQKPAFFGPFGGLHVVCVW